MNNNIFRDYKEYKQKEFDIEIIEEQTVLNIICSETVHPSLLELLDEEYFNYTETETGVIVEDSSFDELIETLSDYELETVLNEASLIRKMVVRNGRRKIIYRCPPGHKNVKRRCVKRPAGELARLKRSARKGARKARSKRARAIRRRKISLKRRVGFAKKRHK